MNRNTLNNEYFQWMYDLVIGDEPTRHSSYQRLLSYLHNREFVYTIGMDGNRAEDGIDLRYRFAYENDYDDAMVARYLDDKPCSILEMMVALAIRCEEHIMDNPDVGNRTGQWFWNMVETLGLISMDDRHFDERYTESVVDRFLNRDYKRNGKGGLFEVKNCRRDLRGVEIWYQMCWYLDSIL